MKPNLAAILILTGFLGVCAVLGGLPGYEASVRRDLFGQMRVKSGGNIEAVYKEMGVEYRGSRSQRLTLEQMRQYLAR